MFSQAAGASCAALMNRKLVCVPENCFPADRWAWSYWLLQPNSTTDLGLKLKKIQVEVRDEELHIYHFILYFSECFCTSFLLWISADLRVSATFLFFFLVLPVFVFFFSAVLSVISLTLDSPALTGAGVSASH